jgi:hypothetical protein
MPCRAVDSTGIKVEGEGALSAACLACACRVISGTHASIPILHCFAMSREVGARSISGSTSKHWRFGPSTARQAICMANLPRGEITGSHIGDAPVLPDLLSQIPADEEIASVTAPSRDIASRCPAGQWTAPMIPGSAMMLSLTAAPARSSRPARTRSRGRPSPLVQSPETRHCAPQNISAVRSGETGADTTAEAASRRTLSGSCDA